MCDWLIRMNGHPGHVAVPVLTNSISPINPETYTRIKALFPPRVKLLPRPGDVISFENNKEKAFFSVALRDIEWIDHGELGIEHIITGVTLNEH